MEPTFLAACWWQQERFLKEKKKRAFLFPYFSDSCQSDYHTQRECGAVPVFCSVIGVVARGTDFMSKGLSDGSNVYW